MLFNAETQSRKVAEIGFREYLGLFLATKNTKATKFFVNSVSFVAKEFSLRLCASALIILSVGIADAQERVPPVVLATVGKTPITQEMVRMTAARNGYDIRDAASAERALRETADFEVLAAEAERAGFFADPEIVATMKRMAVAKLVAAKVDKEHPPKLLTEEQLAAYYKKYVAEEFTRPAVARGRLLFVAKRDGWEKKVETIEGELKKNTAFGELAHKHSEEATSRVSGGLTPWLVENRPNRRYPDAVVSALFAIKKVGDVSPKIDTETGCYWIQLTELRSGSVTPYEQAKRTISRKLAERERLEAYGAYVASLKDAVPVSVDPQAVSNLLKNVSSGSLPPMGPVRMRMGK